MVKPRSELFVLMLTSTEHRRLAQLAELTTVDEGSIVRKLIVASYRAAKREPIENDEDFN